MGIGHAYKQNSFSGFNDSSRFRYNHGGEYRRRRRGRKQRPLSTKDPLHVVFKINKLLLRGQSLRQPVCFLIIQKLINKYSQKFFVKIEQISIQKDHIHLLIRTTRRSHFHYFFRVVAGQIAQRFLKEGLLLALKAPVLGEKNNFSKSVTGTPMGLRKGTKLWKFRPFSRVVKSYKDYKTVINYINLNELEAQGKVPYKKQRLKGLSTGEWELINNFS